MRKMGVVIFIISDVLSADISPEEIWHNIYNSGQEERCYDIAVDRKGNLYATGYSLFDGVNSNIFLVKYDSTGEVKWYRTHDITNSVGYGVSVDGDSCIYVGGRFSTSHRNRILLKYNSMGEVIWAKENTTAKDRSILDIFFNDNSVYGGGESDGGFMIVGYDRKGNIILDKVNNVTGQNHGRGIFVDKNGYIYLCGFTQTETSNYDIVTMKCDSSGNIIWEKEYNYSSFDAGHSVVCDKEGNVYTAGRVPTPSYYNLILLKYDASGNLIWDKFYDSVQSDGATAMEIDEADDIYIGLYSGNNLRLIKYNSDGILLWETEFETNTQPQSSFSPLGVEVDDYGYVYIGGAYYNGDNHDFCVVKYRQFLHINGYVTDENGNPIQGVVIELSGDREECDTTDANGYYEFINLPNDGSYKLKIISSRSFTPVEYNYTPLIYNRNFQNFSIQGIVNKRQENFLVRRKGGVIEVEYLLSERSSVEINLLDISGRVLKSFKKDNISGFYQLLWHVDSSGIYFVTYRKDNFFSIEKVVIVE